MELHSEPTYETELVTDIDIAFLGNVQSIVLREGDTMDVNEDTLVITLQRPDNPAGSETITLFRQHVLYVSRRPRYLKKAIQKHPKANPFAPPLPGDTQSASD